MPRDGKKIHLTDEQRKEAATLFGYDMSIPRIAAYLRMSPDTLERMIKKDPELKMAMEKGRANMGTELRQLAMSQARAGNVPMIIFLLKTREGFRETDRLEVTGADGAAVKHEHSVENLSDAELKARVARYERLLKK